MEAATRPTAASATSHIARLRPGGSSPPEASERSIVSWAASNARLAAGERDEPAAARDLLGASLEPAEPSIPTTQERSPDRHADKHDRRPGKRTDEQLVPAEVSVGSVPGHERAIHEEVRHQRADEDPDHGPCELRDPQDGHGHAPSIERGLADADLARDLAGDCLLRSADCDGDGPFERRAAHEHHLDTRQ